MKMCPICGSGKPDSPVDSIMTDQPELDEYALFEADVAYLKSRREGETQSKSVQAAIKAYLNALVNPRVIDLEKHFE